ncbi:hypothetical protein [Victivallis sp. Marseille-Q1083]|uniref:hypothetical protein n=1 Tax=Victivallis sp. Marseille-Q1083 TaxID=2717288 RepID=UPI00158BA8FE|nr:hypothetical protein [Victivallis sp. Marseille-Q1083]
MKNFEYFLIPLKLSRLSFCQSLQHVANIFIKITKNYQFFNDFIRGQIDLAAPNTVLFNRLKYGISASGRLPAEAAFQENRRQKPSIFRQRICVPGKLRYLLHSFIQSIPMKDKR